MILAAGRGERMRPLTDHCPKPLLKVQGIALIEHHIRNLAAAGIKDIVINHAWLGQQIEQSLGDGRQWRVNICYSAESDGALETAGGIIKALPLLGPSPFLVVNGDIFTAFDFAQLPLLPEHALAHLCLVANPAHNLAGDFSMTDGMLQNLSVQGGKVQGGEQSYTYSGIAIFSPGFFQQATQQSAQVLRLAPLLRQGASAGKISASIITDDWTDVGTPERLEQLNKP